MTYIPDTTTPIKHHFTTAPDEPNGYYEGLLTPENKRYFYLYDSVVEEVANAFSNFDVCLDIGDDLAEDDGTPLYDSITEEDLIVLEKPEVQRCIKLALLQYMELSRNDMVVAALDEQWGENENDEKFNEMEKDFKEMTQEEFLEKYPLRDLYINQFDF